MSSGTLAVVVSTACADAYRGLPVFASLVLRGNDARELGKPRSDQKTQRVLIHEGPDRDFQLLTPAYVFCQSVSIRPSRKLDPNR